MIAPGLSKESGGARGQGEITGKEREMRRSVLLIACLWAGWSASPASAILLYGVSYPGDIYEIDQTTGTRSLFMNGIGVQWLDAADGATPTAFFATGDNGSLYEIDVQAHSITPLGSYGGGVVIKTLAYVEPGHGTPAGLYGSDYQNLYRIDVDRIAGTATAALLGPIHGAGGPFIGVWSMDYNPDTNRLYITNQLFNTSTLYTVDPVTAEATSPISIQNETPINDMWYDHDSARMLAMRYGEAQLFKIDTLTGQLTDIGTPLIGSEKCLDVMGLGSPGVPEPAAGLLVLFAAAMVMRRRR
jgi:hypothetical protein